MRMTVKVEGNAFLVLVDVIRREVKKALSNSIIVVVLERLGDPNSYFRRNLKPPLHAIQIKAKLTTLV